MKKLSYYIKDIKELYPHIKNSLILYIQSKLEQIYNNYPLTFNTTHKVNEFLSSFYVKGKDLEGNYHIGIIYDFQVVNEYNYKITLYVPYNNFVEVTNIYKPSRKELKRFFKYYGCKIPNKYERYLYQMYDTNNMIEKEYNKLIVIDSK